MTRTTPPRPLDVTALFPDLAAYATTATRLHPRPGAPAVGDSSVGGPLLWPAGEPWPVCEDGDAHYVRPLRTPQSLRDARAVHAAAWEQPVPFVPVAQLYRRDVPDFAGPPGADVLQILWCPLDHPEAGYNPRVAVYWRDAAAVGRLLDEIPQPPVVNDNYLPTPCVLHPEQVREYQYSGLLPEDLQSRLAAWRKQNGRGAFPSYQYDLSLAPGWKVGGYANWSLTDPYPMDCSDCGTPMRLLFTAASREWQGTGSWRPVEEADTAPVGPTGIVIGRGYALYVFHCPASFDHPVATAMQ